MIAMVLGLPLITFVIALGVLVPWLGLRFETMHQCERRLIAAIEAKDRLILEQGATIEAYRELVALDEKYRLAPPSPSPGRWTQLALASRVS